MKFIRFYIWSIALETWTLKRLEQKYFEMWCWRRMEMIKWSEKVINKKVLQNKKTFKDI
jgi:hypothetical protein